MEFFQLANSDLASGILCLLSVYVRTYMYVKSYYGSVQAVSPDFVEVVNIFARFILVTFSLD